MPDRVRAWLDRWAPILPLLAAEFIIWLGFGGLLPVLPIYFKDQGLDLATLGLVIAAWPAARLLSEPAFGWLADRTARVPLMVIGLVAAGIFGALPLVWTGAIPFVILRAGAGVATALYDPAARGYLTDATPRDRHGEAFGLYGAAQMGGLILGPAIGAFGADRFGGFAFVFIFSAIAAFVAAGGIALRVREGETVAEHSARVKPNRSILPSEPYVERPVAPAFTREADDTVDGPRRLLNRGLVAAIILNFGGYFGGGTYEVIWSLFLQGLGADLTLIGLTFTMFAVPVLVLSPFAGRLVDRRGPLAFIVVGMLLPAVAALSYTLIRDAWLAVPLILLEGTGFAFINPGTFTVVAASSPAGRSSTAQGLFGAAGTLGFIAASVTTGILAQRNILFPFYAFAAVMVTSLALALVVGGPRLRRQPVPPASSTAVSAI
jgi:DHA1 family multidrug resistance protein-like MFS transporter